MLTTEELLIPRWKVIAGWPGIENHNCKVGDIIADDGRTAAKNQDDIPQFIVKWNDYPNLFQPLQWWEGREPEDMPEYTKMVYNGGIKFVQKVERWEGFNCAGQPLYRYLNRVGQLSTFCVDELEPATEQEYLTYKQQNNG